MRSAPSILLCLSFASLVGCGPSQSSPADGAPVALADAALSDAGVADATGGVADADTGLPSGSYVYFHGDFEVESVDRVGRMDLGNRTSSILAISGLDGGEAITGLAISPDGESLAVAGEDEAGSSSELQLYPADGSGAPLVLFTAADTERRIGSIRFSPDGNWIAFLADSELLGSRALHVVPVDASAAAKRVSLAPVSATQDVAQFVWAPDSLHMAFLGDLVENNVTALWTVNATVIAPSPTEIVTTAELGDADVLRGLGFDAQNRIYYRTDLATGDKEQLLRSDLDGMNRQQVPGTALANDAGEAAVGAFAISPDGVRVAFASESPSENLYQVYVLDLASMAPALVSNLTATAPTNGTTGPNFFEGLRWSPGGDQLVMTADWPTTSGVDNDFGVFVLPTNGLAGGVRLATPVAPAGDAFRPTFDADGMRIVFIGDMLVEGHNDLFVTTDFAAADQDLTELRAVDSSAAGSIDGFVLDPL